MPERCCQVKKLVSVKNPGVHFTLRNSTNQRFGTYSLLAVIIGNKNHIADDETRTRNPWITNPVL